MMKITGDDDADIVGETAGVRQRVLSHQNVAGRSPRVQRLLDQDLPRPDGFVTPTLTPWQPVTSSHCQLQQRTVSITAGARIIAGTRGRI